MFWKDEAPNTKSIMTRTALDNSDTQEELIEKIRKLQKEVDRLNAQLKEKRFGLTWIDVPEAFEKESENKIPVLEEVPELAIHNDDGKPTHILIEGDNYHALTCLNYTHHGKVDIIYIDPPYNTGSDGFTYKDKRFLEEYPDGTPVPKNHPLRHSAWLSFMQKRLRLAHDLLKDDGVIFISINEDELANLRLLLDEVFEASNYITTFTIKVRHEDRILKGDKPIHETTEFLLMYRRSDSFQINKRSVDNSDPSEYKYEIKELIDTPEKTELGGKEVEVFKPGEYRIDELPADFSHLKSINIRGSIKTGNSSGRFHMSYLEERNNFYGYLYKVPGMGDDGRGYRYFLTRSGANKANGFYFQGSPINREDIKEIPYPNFFDFEQEFNNVGTEGGVPFDGGKKPVAFVRKIIEIAKGDKEDLIVLDFFAGSGSTGHSIVERNLVSNGNQAILVQLPEPTYEIKRGVKVAKANCKNVFNAGFENITEITYKRFRNIINGYNDSKMKSHDGLGNSLKYYRTAFVGKNQPKSATDDDKLTLAKKAGCLLGLAENTLYETEATDYYQFYTDECGHWTCIYFQEDYSHFEEFRKKVVELEGNEKSVYVFCWTDGSEFASEFEFEKNITVKSIPQPILNIYKSLNA
jgi:adenine-specific DNA-methyltransferase